MEISTNIASYMLVWNRTQATFFIFIPTSNKNLKQNSGKHEQENKQQANIGNFGKNGFISLILNLIINKDNQNGEEKVFGRIKKKIKDAVPMRFGQSSLKD